jgi:hypothetical protein
MAEQNSIQSLSDFVKSLSSAQYDDFRTRADAKVESANAFDQMKDHLLKLYQNVEAQHTFIENGGKIVDCIPIEQQPSLRSWKGRILSAPPPPQLYETETEQVPSKTTAPAPGPLPTKPPPPQLHPDYRDRFGNQMWCPTGTIPMVRITLEELSRFKNLRDFFRKAPGGSSLPGTAIETKEPQIDMTIRRHAVALQHVRNIGATSNINVWNPALGSAKLSLSQIWLIGGDGARLQTVECGWHVYPGSVHPRLFIYWTADNYETTGCYNLACDGFCQTDGSSILGGALASSQVGPDQQVEFKMGFFLAQGAWWFYLNNQAVGYYPVSIFRNGPLTAEARLLHAGGEVVRNTVWPPMGSGFFAGNGFAVAAYQHNVAYAPPPSGGLRLARLEPHEPSPGCYTVGVQNFSSSAWNTYFFFGGPGGASC